MKRQIFSLFLLLLTLVACGDKPLDPNKPVYVKIKTTMGDVTVLLYDDTPLHRDNFIKLCQSNEYEGMLFHRVIKEFVVQGGDPESKAHEPGALYGDGDGGYTVPAEILPNHFNKPTSLVVYINYKYIYTAFKGVKLDENLHNKLQGLMSKFEQAVQHSIITNKAKADNNPNNMRAIALLRSLSMQGKSLSEMTCLLNEQGFVTSKGCKFQITQVKRLLVRAGLMS